MSTTGIPVVQCPNSCRPSTLACTLVCWSTPCYHCHRQCNTGLRSTQQSGPPRETRKVTGCLHSPSCTRRSARSGNLHCCTWPGCSASSASVQRRAPVKAIRLVCRPVLQLVLCVAVPHTITGTGEDDLSAAAHAKVAAHIDGTTIGLCSKPADLNKILSGPNSALAPVTKHPMADGECLLESRDGVKLLEDDEQTSEVVQHGCVVRVVVAMQAAALLNSFEACNDLAPLQHFHVQKAVTFRRSLPCAAPTWPWLCCKSQVLPCTALAHGPARPAPQHPTVLSCKFLHDGQGLHNGLACNGTSLQSIMHDELHPSMPRRAEANRGGRAVAPTPHHAVQVATRP